MRKSTKAMLMGAVAGLGMAAWAHAAPIINTTVTLYQATLDPINGDSDSGVPVPTVGGVYQLTQGEKFFVVLDAGITAGTENKTGSQAGRAASTRNKPLGLGSLTANILSPSNGVVTPINNGNGQWAQYSDDTPDGYGYPFTNLSDVNSDGVPDVDGAGFGDSTLSASNTTQLGRAQYGDDPSDGTVNGYANPMPLVEGEYIANASGTGSLTTQFQAAYVYQDPGTNNSLSTTAANGGENAGSVSVAIAVIPEPASLGLLGCIGLAFGRRRRSK